MIVSLMVAVAVALLLWPDKPVANPFAAGTLPAAKPASNNYLDAVVALQTVCKRLADTEKLDQAQQKAIDSLMLALVQGCDK
jgi:hypothetical protein